MNRITGQWVIVTVLATLLSWPALAGPERREERRQEAQEKIRTLRLMKLVEALDLDEKTGMKVARVLKQADGERKKLHAKAQDKMRALKAEVKASKPRPKVISGLVDELLVVRRELHQIEEKEFTELRKVFTPLQQGQFVLVMHHFRERVQKMLHREGKRHRRGGGPPGPGPGFEE